MRKIKFRAWLKDAKEIIEVEDIQFKDDKKYQIDNIKLQPKKNQSLIINTKSARRTEDKIELMEYIGMEDDNGKEIYEGDIVKVKSGMAYDNYSLIGVITFSCGSFYINDKPIYELVNDNCSFNVIGNIFENSELLKMED